MNLPDFIIIGETKCGTTSLFNYLIKHPRIIEPYGNGDKVDESYATKEIRYFDRYYNRGIEWYKSCFPPTNQDEITGEATPMYMYRALSVNRIKNILPNIKLIVLLRNPVDRLFSNFQHYYKWVPGFKDNYDSFEDYLNSCNDRDYFMIDKGIYINSLNKWFKSFKPHQFFIESTENLNRNTQLVYNNILEFLELESYSLDTFNYFRQNNYTPMKSETYKLLSEFYAPYNEDLFNQIGKDFNWNKDIKEN